jgi:CubicO group peptidase (beta-lactamase class C family)
MKYFQYSGILFLACILLLNPLHSQERGGLTIEAPQNHGFSPERLDRLSDNLKRELAVRKTPGAAVLIMRHGVIVFEETFGYQDLVSKQPMELNSIFRIYSMTKPITSVAVMMLWEQGYFKLDDPVSLYIPEFSGMKVAVENEDQTEINSLVEAQREITIQDLLRHTSGITYGIFGKETAVRKKYIEAGISPARLSSQQFIETVTKLPLIAHPGERWEYGYSTDVLGCLVEKVSGMRLGDFFQRHIFTPLKMEDTGFHIPADKLNRAAHGFDHDTNTYPSYLKDVAQPPLMQSGGGGLVSTLYDYARFSQMMLNGGVLDGVRLLGSKTVETMTSNHLDASVAKGDLYLPGPGYGFGLGYAVRLEKGISATAGSQGDYRWGGWAGTGIWIDPGEEVISIYMMQDVGSAGNLRDRFKALVYQAIVE